MHGCDFESGRRRKLIHVRRNEAVLCSYGDRTQSNRSRAGGEVVHRLWLGLEVETPAQPVNNFGEPIRGVNETGQSFLNSPWV